MFDRAKEFRFIIRPFEYPYFDTLFALMIKLKLLIFLITFSNRHCVHPIVTMKRLCNLLKFSFLFTFFFFEKLKGLLNSQSEIASLFFIEFSESQQYNLKHAYQSAGKYLTVSMHFLYNENRFSIFFCKCPTNYFFFKLFFSSSTVCKSEMVFFFKNIALYCDVTLPSVHLYTAFIIRFIPPHSI